MEIPAILVEIFCRKPVLKINNPFKCLKAYKQQFQVIMFLTCRSLRRLRARVGDRFCITSFPPESLSFWGKLVKNYSQARSPDAPG